jgi:predicted RNase H-like HicB family nuclease
VNDYLVIYEQAEDGGWGAHAPDLKSVFAFGTTRDECESRMRGAIALHFELLKEQGSAVPVPVHSAGYIAA